MEQADAAATEAEGAASAKAADCAAKKSRLESSREQLAGELGSLPEGAWQEATEQAIEAQAAQRKALDAALKTAQKADARAKAISGTELPNAEKALADAGQKVTGTASAFAAAAQTLEKAAEEVGKAAEGLMPEGWDEALLKASIDANEAAGRTQNGLKKQAEKDIQRLEEIAARQGELGQQLEQETDLLHQHRQKAAEEQQRGKGLLARITETRTRLTWASRDEAEADLKRAQARSELLQNAIRDAGEQLQNTVNQLSERNGRIATLRQQLQDSPETDVERLKQFLFNAQAAYEQKELLDRGCFSRRQSNLRQIGNLQARAEEAVRLEREFRMMQDVANTASGRVSGQAKLTLETYAQMALFDRILRHANLRLRHMSREQYELKRRPLEQAGNRSQTGLDLDVIDHYNGTVR